MFISGHRIFARMLVWWVSHRAGDNMGFSGSEVGRGARIDVRCKKLIVSFRVRSVQYNNHVISTPCYQGHDLMNIHIMSRALLLVFQVLVNLTIELCIIFGALSRSEPDKLDEKLPLRDQNLVLVSFRHDFAFEASLFLLSFLAVER